MNNRCWQQTREVNDEYKLFTRIFRLLFYVVSSGLKTMKRSISYGKSTARFTVQGQLAGAGSG